MEELRATRSVARVVRDRERTSRVTRLRVTDAAPGWVRHGVPERGDDDLALRAITVEHVTCGARATLSCPRDAVRVEKEIRKVITAIAKTPLWTEQRASR